MDAPSPNETVGCSSGRGLGFLGELRFAWSFAHLLGSVALETLLSVVRLLYFLPRRKAHRARIRDLIVRADASAPPAVLVWALAVVAGWLVSGCGSQDVPSSDEPRMHGASSSFERQLAQVGESAEALWNMDHDQESLEDDLEAFSEDTSLEVVGEDAVEILLDPHGQQSIEDDFRAFSDPEPDQLRDTLDLWGW